MAIALQRPDSARARPSSLLKKDDEYRKVFSEQYPIQLYEKTVAVMRRVDGYLRSFTPQLEREDQTNLRYYIALDLVVALLGTSRPSMDKIAELDLDSLTDVQIKKSLGRLKLLYDNLGATDQVAKGPQLLAAWRESLQGKKMEVRTVKASKAKGFTNT
jgi:hypothetical protein